MMIEVDDVWRLIDRDVVARSPVSVPLERALGTTLAEPAIADADAPPFDRVTVDGYAVRRDDAGEEFSVIGTVAAGANGALIPGPGEALRILTGAALPSRELRVIMQEDAERAGDRVRFRSRPTATFVCERGEDARAGQTLLPAGIRLGAAELAVLASVGVAEPRVVRPLRILHFTGGDEIVPVTVIPKPGEIRNCNATLIRGLAGAFPLESFRHVHLPDDAAAAGDLTAAAKPADFDVVIFSGGSSVGDHDHSRAHMEALGFDIRCGQVNVRPGKPFLLGVNGTRIAMGLPGNPVSHFACFHLFVARVLARMSGRGPTDLESAVLAAAIPGTVNPRVTFWPAVIGVEAGEIVVHPLPWNSSGHLAALPGVNALVRLPADAELPMAGATVQILNLKVR